MNARKYTVSAALVVAFWLLGADAAQAQPAEAVVKADVKKTFPKAVNIAVPGPGRTTRETVNNAVTNVHRRSVAVTVPATHPVFKNVQWVYNGAALYHQVGGAFRYIKYNPGNEELIGMPDPDRSQVLAMIDKCKDEIIKLSQRNRIVGEKLEFSLPEKPKYTWANFDRVAFQMVCTYEELTNDIGDAEVIKQVFDINMYGKDGGNWERLLATHATGEGSRTVLQTKKYTRQQLDTLQRYEQVRHRAAATAKRATLEKLDIPKMSTTYDVMDFIHGIFMENSAAKTEALLYNMLASHFFSPADKITPTADAVKLINQLVEYTATGERQYHRQYCGLPDIKETGAGYIDYWNKNKSAYTRLELGSENGQWKIGGISMYMVSQTDQARQLEALPCTKLALSAVERGLRAAPTTNLRANAQVLALYEQDGFWYPATYKSSANNFHQVTYLIDGKPGNVRSVIPFSLQAGDKAIVKSQNGSLVEVVIKEVKSGGNVVFDYGGKETTFQARGLQFRL